MDEDDTEAMHASLAMLMGQMAGVMAWLQALTVTHPNAPAVLAAFDAYVAPIEAKAVGSPIAESAVDAVLEQIRKVRTQIPAAPRDSTT